MPKSTFLNLPSEKKQRLIEVFKSVFLVKDLSKLTVTDFVQASKIPRGSFYQYFDDLDDLYRFLFIDTIEDYQNVLLLRTQATRMAFFDYMESLFVLDLKYMQESNHYRIIHKFFTHPNLSGMSVTLFEEKRRAFVPEILSRLDKIELEALKIEEIIDLYHTISHVKMLYIQKALKGVLDVSTAHKKYQLMLKIIRSGVKELDYA